MLLKCVIVGRAVRSLYHIVTQLEKRTLSAVELSFTDMSHMTHLFGICFQLFCGCAKQFIILFTILENDMRMPGTKSYFALTSM